MKVKTIKKSRFNHIIEIDDKIISLGFNKGGVSETIDFVETIYNIETYLKNKDYCVCNKFLVDTVIFINMKNLINILLIAFFDEFIVMFRYFTYSYIKNVDNFDAKTKKYCFPSNVMSEIFKNDNKKLYKDISMYGALTQKSNNAILSNIIEEEIKLFWIPQIRNSLLEHENLSYYNSKIGIKNTLYLCECYLNSETISCLKYMAEQFTKKRNVVTYSNLFGAFVGYENIKCNPLTPDCELIIKMKQIAEDEYKIQINNFVKENYKELNKDVWKIYWFNGPALNSHSYNFNTINSITLRKELKSYMRYRYNRVNNKNDSFLPTISIAINYLSENNKEIKFFADITDVDVANLTLFLENDYVTQFGNNLSVSSIKKSIKHCGQIIEYLKSNNRESSLNTPIPDYNYFSRRKFKNIKKYHKRTLAIPESVLTEVNKYIEELEYRHQLMYKTFINSGLRLKEVVYLEENCIEPSKYDGLFVLKYIPYKILVARRKKNLEDYHRIFITTELSNYINEQIKNTYELRNEYDSKFIFINQNKNRRATISQGQSFTRSLNNLVKKHSIKDESGNIYNFISKQFRKTIAVKLIEDGASTEEVAYFLGHLSMATAKDYYEEVREIKLAKLNTKFFKEKFDVIISSENLNVFTEEERRLLYVDFRLQHRQVELGYCIKQFKEGPCDKKNRQLNCVNCQKLCTGKKYLTYWLKLRDEQQIVINELIKFYEEHNIYDYKDFAEFQQESYLLKCYIDVVEKILKTV